MTPRADQGLSQVAPPQAVTVVEALPHGRAVLYRADGTPLVPARRAGFTRPEERRP